MQFNNQVLAGLSAAANLVSQQIAQNVISENLPGEIVSNMIVQAPVQDSETSAHVDIVINLDEGAAPMAGAFEFGSGIWATRGQRGYIIITSKTPGGMLKFPFPESMNIYPSLNIPGGNRVGGAAVPNAPRLNYTDEEGTVYLPYVRHPGVAPREYIAKALKQKQEEVERLFSRLLAVEFDIMIKELNAQP